MEMDFWRAITARLYAARIQAFKGSIYKTRNRYEVLDWLELRFEKDIRALTEWFWGF
jgi:hypothetical protein